MVRQVKHDRNNDPYSIIAGPELVAWLNAKWGEEQEERDRVRSFLGLVQSAQRVAQEMSELQNDTRPSHPIFQRARNLSDAINTYLTRYPLLYRFRIYGPEVRTALELLDGDKQKYKEFRYINAVLKIAERRSITDIRECNCGKLFLARSSLTRFCSPACRIAFWENSEERKQKKREKAREYYELHKRGIVRGRSRQRKSK
jgi:hypothetical protein